MNTRTDLTITTQGITEKDGDVTIIDNTDEHIEAVMSFTFRKKNEDVHQFGAIALGAFSTKYYSEIILHLIQTIGRAQFIKALMLAELTSGYEKHAEDFAGGH